MGGSAWSATIFLLTPPILVPIRPPLLFCKWIYWSRTRSRLLALFCLGGRRGSLFTATQSATLCSFGICVYWRSASRMGYFGPSPLECYLWSACLPETIVPRPTNLIVLIGIRLGASLPVRPDRRTSIELVVFCSLTLSKYFSPGLLRVPPSPRLPLSRMR